MNQKDLYMAIEMITHKLQEFKYPINDKHALDVRILEYNKNSHHWETYNIDERGGHHDLQTFSTEDEACAYILDHVIALVKTIINSYTDAVKRAYLRENE